MIVLAIDSALDACSVAITRDGETLAHLSEQMNRGQAERLAPMVLIQQLGRIRFQRVLVLVAGSHMLMLPPYCESVRP